MVHLSLLYGVKILNVSRYNVSGPGQTGKVIMGTFELEGQLLMALNGGPMFKFTEAVSLFVNCETQDELDYFWEKLPEGGEIQMCGWLKDKFGLSWQIIPSILAELLQGKDDEKSQRTMQTMLKMSKIDIKALQEA